MNAAILDVANHYPTMEGTMSNTNPFLMGYNIKREI